MREELVRRTFVLPENTDRILNRMATLNKIHGNPYSSVSALMRRIIHKHLLLTRPEKVKIYQTPLPTSIGLDFPLTGHSRLTKVESDDSNTYRTFTIEKEKLRSLEVVAAKNKFESLGPRTVNALLLFLVNHFIDSAINNRSVKNHS